MRLWIAVTSLIVAAAAPRASAATSLTFHTFVISEVYSSPDGHVQFVELVENFGFGGQHLLAGHRLTATSADGTLQHSFTFPANLPSSNTADRHVLIATAGFAALPGGITPDYIIPAHFLHDGGTVNFADLPGTGPTVTYNALPADGRQSLHFPPYPGGSAADNSPTNFAGQSGSINVPPATGACCQGVACSVQSSARCATASGVYQGDGVICGAPGNPVACCPANFNALGGVTVQDIFDFLGAYFSGDPAADFNGLGGITVQDIFDFLNAYFTGCRD